MSRRAIRPAALIGITIIFAIPACSSDLVDPDQMAPIEVAADTFGQTLIECPVNEDKSVIGILGATGGTIGMDNHRLSLPPLAVALPTSFELRARASNYLELRVRANDMIGFDFNRTATITIDYSRCNRSNIEKFELTVWKIDPDSKRLLEHMGGVDDKVARTVTFQTDHLSTFSIAR
jgi:hypothetical protein